jgi:hypothetical protein
MALVTGMIITGATVSLPEQYRVYGETIRDRGAWEHVEWAGRSYTMSRELVLVVGRPCDPPGCAASANP